MRTAPSAGVRDRRHGEPQASGLPDLRAVPHPATPVPCYKGTVTGRPGSELPEFPSRVTTRWWRLLQDLPVLRSQLLPVVRGMPRWSCA